MLTLFVTKDSDNHEKKIYKFMESLRYKLIAVIALYPIRSIDFFQFLD